MWKRSAFWNVSFVDAAAAAIDAANSRAAFAFIWLFLPEDAAAAAAAAAANEAAKSIDDETWLPAAALMFPVLLLLVLLFIEGDALGDICQLVDAGEWEFVGLLIASAPVLASDELLAVGVVVVVDVVVETAAPEVAVVDIPLLCDEGLTKPSLILTLSSCCWALFVCSADA